MRVLVVISPLVGYCLEHVFLVYYFESDKNLLFEFKIENIEYIY